ncbi:MAG: hypothetical protein HUU04_05975 [Verrucomicrobiae bacterium]|nr:hypothetical protein [Verrucomicrobiae bacterium]
MKTKAVAGESSWVLRSKTVELAITRRGGHMAPVVFDRQRRAIRPFYIAQWKTPPAGLPPLLRLLRGDFFCMPFGGNAAPFRGERHPLHGETANAAWRFLSVVHRGGRHELILRLRPKVRPGTVTKRIILRDGENVVYQEHLLAGMRGPITVGHHPNLLCRSTGRLATSRLLAGSTYPFLMESPADGNYGGLVPNVRFKKLGVVPLVYGGGSDLSVYPARRGFTDVVQLVNDPNVPVAWSTIAFPEEGWLYFALKNPRTLGQTVLWFSNGGRWSDPWRGDPRDLLGLEDVTSFFAEGLAASAKPNVWRRLGSKTTLELSPKKPTAIRYLFGVASIPKGFRVVHSVRFAKDGLTFVGDRGRAHAKVNWRFVLDGENGAGRD